MSYDLPCECISVIRVCVCVRARARACVPLGAESVNICVCTLGFPGGSDGKESACNAGDLGSIPGLGKFLGEGKDNPLQYSGLENSVDRGTWQATVYGVTKSQTRLSDFHFHFFSKNSLL